MKNFLFNLPHELILKILTKTAIKDHGSMAKTSKSGQGLADDHSQWNPMLMLPFRSNEPGVAKATFLNCPEKRLDEFLDFDEAGKVVKLTRKKIKEFSLLSSEESVHIGIQSTEDFKIILSNPILYNQLDGIDIQNIAQNRIEAVKIISNNVELCNKLNGFMIQNLASNLEATKIILTTPSLYNRLSGINICNIASRYRNNSEVAKIILNNEELRNKVKERGLDRLDQMKACVERAEKSTLAPTFNV